MIGIFPILTIGFGIFRVSSDNRVPKPQLKLLISYFILNKSKFIGQIIIHYCGIFIDNNVLIFEFSKQI